MNEQKTGQGGGSQMRITPDEQLTIQKIFKNNEPLLKLMRKMFLPEIDPNAPVGQVIDLWMTIKTEGMSLEEQLINLKARNQLITHIDQILMQLSMISKLEETTPEQIKEKAVKNSSK